MKGRRSTPILAAAAAMALASGAAAGLDAQERTFEWSDAMSEGRTLEVRNISGDVRAVLATGAEAGVVATKHGDRDDFDEVEIRVLDDGGDIVVCAVWRPRDSRDDCESGDGEGRRWDDEDDIDVSVDFEVRVPSGVRFEGSTVAGDVEARGLRSDVEARTVSGDVTVATTGSAWGRTVSGSLDLEMGRLDPDRASFETVSGDITLRLPDGFGAEIEFSSLSGDFRSDFAGRFERDEERWVGSEVRGTVGDGGPRVRMKTISGDARLTRIRR